MITPYQRDGKWYYTMWGEESGPFDTEEAALDAIEALARVLQGGCPTCED